MDWIHCNGCYGLPDQLGKNNDKRTFVLTNCGHLFCSDCLVEPGSAAEFGSRVAEYVCTVCGSRCTTMPLSANMKPEVAIFFTDIDDYSQKSLKQIVQIGAFQKGHRQRLAEWNKKKVAEMRTANETIMAELNKQKNENIQLKKELNYVKSVLTHSPYTMASNRSQQPQQQRSLPAQDHGGIKQAKPQPMMFRTPSSSSAQSGTPMSTNSGGQNRRVSINAPPVDGRIGFGSGSRHSMYAEHKRTPASQRIVTPNSYSGYSSLSDSQIGVRSAVSVRGQRDIGALMSPFVQPTSDKAGKESISEDPYTQRQRKITLNYPLRSGLGNYLAARENNN